MPHGNSHKNNNLHHLYEITDTYENEVYKFGISDDEIEADGLSARRRNQLSLFNILANFLRFAGRILVRDIPGRKEAERIEEEYIRRHIEQNGKRPRGNRERGNSVGP
jgi:hypothetical protein